MCGSRCFEAEQSVNEGPVAVEESGASVDQMLQHGEDVWEGSGVASERSECGCGELMQLLPAVTACVDQQCSKVLHFADGKGHTELGVAAACVTTHCDEGRLCTQDRHEANGV